MVRVMSLVNSIATTGRHYNVSLMMLCHTATNGAMSKILLNECHAIVLFPANMTGKSSKYLLDNYFGLDKNQKKILKMLILVILLYLDLILWLSKVKGL
jgi:hypothetical protein